MKIRRIPFDIKQAMAIGADFDFRWAYDEQTSLVGLGYSFYLEYIEYFCNFVSKYARPYIDDQALLGHEQTFLTQEMHHAKAHKHLNAFLCKPPASKDAFHPRIYPYLQSYHEAHYKPIMRGITEGKSCAIKDALLKIAVFESKNCISSFIFFEQLFSNANFARTCTLSGNLGILYLLAYHFAEEIEHCDIAVDVYQHIFEEPVWNAARVQSEIVSVHHAEQESLTAALYCAQQLGVDTDAERLSASPFMTYTKARQIDLINADFDLNAPAILELRKSYVRQWDEVWEPTLRHQVLQQIEERALV
ncbi:MAG: metal-dependent hydrolase [Pseudomonas sp.]